MIILFLVLIIIASLILGLIVLIQNPKGGGLTGSIAGFNNQFMGVKQTNDVLEKGTWLFATIVGVLCIISSLFFKGSTANAPDTKLLQQMNTTQPATQQGTQNPSNPATVPLGDTTKH